MGRQQPSWMRGALMSKPAKGTKRVCLSCGARFYDPNRTPIVCPACQSVYQVAPAPSRRGGERAVVQQEARPAPAELKPTPVREKPEIVNMDDADEGAEDTVIAEEEEIVDL